LLDDHKQKLKSRSTDKVESDDGTWFRDVCNEAEIFIFVYNSLLSSSSDNDTPISKHQRDTIDIYNHLDKFEVTSCAVLEALRLIAHSIGAIRKVIAPEGWVLKCSPDNTNGSKNFNGHSRNEFRIPFGSYIGISHVIPHYDQKRCGFKDIRTSFV
jgi:hypothetical protein